MSVTYDSEICDFGKAHACPFQCDTCGDVEKAKLNLAYAAGVFDGSLRMAKADRAFRIEPAKEKPQNEQTESR